MDRVSRTTLVLLVVILSVGCDQTVKSIARSSLAFSSSVSLFHGIVRLEYAENTGAFLSLGSDLSDALRFLLFTVFAVVALVLTLVFIFRGRNISAAQVTAFSLIAAGGIGNIIDRLTNNGAVVDFVSITIGPIQTGIFNLADVAITTGFFMIILASIQHSRILAKISTGPS